MFTRSMTMQIPMAIVKKIMATKANMAAAPTRPRKTSLICSE